MGGARLRRRNYLPLGKRINWWRRCVRRIRSAADETTGTMKTPLRHLPELELALLRRGVDRLSAETESCRRCRRHPLIGERVYGYDSGMLLCELCRALERATPASSHLVHGPEFGHTIRILDQRPVA